MHGSISIMASCMAQTRHTCVWDEEIMLWPATCSAWPAPQGATAGHSITAQLSGTLRHQRRAWHRTIMK
jgi:hypothetical protein